MAKGVGKLAIGLVKMVKRTKITVILCSFVLLMLVISIYLMQDYNILLPSIYFAFINNDDTNLASAMQERTQRPYCCGLSTSNSGTEFFKTQSLHEMIAIDKNNSDLNIDNWASFYKRCYTDSGTYFFNRDTAVSWKNYFRYSRMQKAASATISSGINRLKKNGDFSINRIKYNYNSNYAYDKEYEFTFVRNPMTRFFSAFHQVVYLAIERCHSDDNISNMDMNCNNRQIYNGINMHQSWENIYNHYKNNNTTGLIKQWIDIMYNRQLDWYNNNNNYYSYWNIISYWRYYYFFNVHLYPNVLRLFHVKQYDWSFIGNIKNLNQDLPKILIPYLKNQTKNIAQNNPQLFMKNNFYSKHHRNSKRDYSDKMSKAFVLDLSNLRSEINGNEYINKICQIYWIDFICLPFQVPDECNLTQMYQQHYNKHIKYQQCLSGC